MTTKKPTSKKTPTKPKAKKPAAKKVVAKPSSADTSTQAVHVRIEAHEAGHVHAPIAAGTVSTPKKKKSLWKRFFGFGF